MLPAELTGLSCIICSQFPDIGHVTHMGIREGNLRQKPRTIAGMTKPPSIKENIHIYTCTYIYIHICIYNIIHYIYRVSQEECARLQESVPYANYTDTTQNTYAQS